MTAGPMSFPYRRGAGAAATSSPSRCCPTCWPSRTRASRGPTRPGSSIRKGRVTEGSSTNAWIVDDAGRVITRDLGANILGGITRQTVIRLAREAGIEVVERAFTLAEAQAAPEAFLTSTTSFVRAIVRIDGCPVGTGEPGPVTVRLRDLYLAYCRGGRTNR